MIDPLLRNSVRQSVKSCTNCPLHLQCRGPVPFRGPAPSRIAIIGEAPGETEDEMGKPFVGPSGELVAKWLRDKDLARYDPAFLNVVSCYPHRTPTQREVKECHVNLVSQLEIIHPQFVILFGGVAVSAWWPEIRMGEIRGNWWRGGITGKEVHGRDWMPWMMATWHPAAVLRNRQLEKDVLDDLERFAKVVEGTIQVPFNHLCIKCKGPAEIWEKDLGWCIRHKTMPVGRVKASTTGQPSRNAKQKPVQQKLV